jgi:hypothetical protein
MKKLVTILMILGTFVSVSSAATYNTMMKKQCQYNLSIIDEYNTIANGYLMGIVVGIQASIPTDQRSKITKQSIGFISDKACILALNSDDDAGFEYKYKEAALKIMSK